MLGRIKIFFSKKNVVVNTQYAFLNQSLISIKYHHYIYDLIFKANFTFHFLVRSLEVNVIKNLVSKMSLNVEQICKIDVIFISFPLIKRHYQGCSCLLVIMIEELFRTYYQFLYITLNPEHTVQ